jgi:hypothetical protein
VWRWELECRFEMEGEEDINEKRVADWILSRSPYFLRRFRQLLQPEA